MDDDQIRNWKEMVNVYLDVISRHLSGVSEENYENPLKIICNLAYIRKMYLSNRSLERCHYIIESGASELEAGL
jgi:hypothetical protein